MTEELKFLRTFSITLLAGQPFRLPVAGNTFSVISATTSFDVRVDENYDFKSMEQGLGFELVEGQSFSELVITSASGQSVVIAAGFGKIHDSRTSITGTINATVTVANVIDAIADVSVDSASTPKLLIAADSDRKSVDISILASAAVGIRLGEQTMGANEGFYLPPGGAISIPTEAAVYALLDSGTTAVTAFITAHKRT